MTRVALYARYSTDNQHEASIEDRFRICREDAKSEKWKNCRRLQERRNFGSCSLWGPRSRFGATSQMLLPPVVLTSLGSASNRVLSGGWGGQHASPQKFDACTTIHFSLENFESVDRALGLAVAPALCQALSCSVALAGPTGGPIAKRMQKISYAGKERK
jgi:hypothetical protein